MSHQWSLKFEVYQTLSLRSIPHASSPANGHNGAHPALSISPTNSTSPINKESGLGHGDNTNATEEEHNSLEEAATSDNEPDQAEAQPVELKATPAEESSPSV